MELLHLASLHLPHNDCRKTSYIHIARDDLHRRDLFKPAQYLRSHLDQLPLLRLRTQATSYIPSHLHLSNNHTYTPYDQRHCPSCLPPRSWVTNSTPSYTVPTLLTSPILPSLALPALFVDLISARGPHTPRSNKLRFSLGPDPLNSFKNMTKHGLTLPPLHALNSFTHFNLTFPNTYPHGLPHPYRPSFPLWPASPLMIHSARCAKVPLTRKECSSATYVTPVGTWAASSPPSPPSLLVYGNVPCAPPLLPRPRAHYDTSASPPPF